MSLGISSGREKAEPGLAPLPVIENLDVFGDVARRLLPAGIAAVMNQLFFSVPQKLSIGALS